MKIITRRRSLQLLAAWVGLAASGLSADELPTIVGGLEITNIVAEPGAADEAVAVTFRIENYTSKPVKIRGLEIEGDIRARLVGSLGKGETAMLPFATVQPDHSILLRKGAAWFETGPLTRDWRPGTHLAAKLILDRFEIPIEVHVGSTTELSGREEPSGLQSAKPTC